MNRCPSLRGPLAVVAALASLSIVAPALAGPGGCNPSTGVIPAPTAVHQEGDPAPGTGAAFQNFGRPSLSETGVIAFTGDTDGATASDAFVYCGSTLLAQEGSPALPTGGTFQSFALFETAQYINAAGDCIFVTTLAGVPTTANHGIFKNGATLIALEGNPAPGIPGRLFVDFFGAGIADDGTVGFLADLDGATTDDSVIYYGSTILYRQGGLVPSLPGIPPGTTWDGDFAELAWNGNGDLLFVGNSSMPGAADQLLMRRRAIPGMGVVEDVLAVEGQTVDLGLGTPGTLTLYLQTSLAQNGQWAMRGNLTGPGPDNDAIILTGAGFNKQQGQPAPELPGVVIGNFNGVDINSCGDVLYLADLAGSTDPLVTEGLFVNDRLVATTGMQVQGMPAGVRYTDIMFERMYINDNRTIIFHANYTGGDGIFSLTIPSFNPADLDHDGDVDGIDLAIMLGQWTGAATYAPCPPFRPADLNQDCKVNGMDIAILLGAWG